MGFSQCWVAIKGASGADVLTRLSLEKTGERSACAENGWTCVDSLDGWFLVIQEHCKDELLADNSNFLSAMSAKHELLVVFIEEHVMFSMAAEWQNGREVWRIEHDAQKSLRDLTASGKLPACFDSIRNQLAKEQDATTEVDFISEIPLKVAYSKCPYQHDFDLGGLGDEPFELLRSLKSNGSSSQKNIWSKIRSAMGLEE